MAEPRDRLDAWLAEPVRPLSPPPGAFTEIRRRARRRKVRQAAVATVAAAAGISVAAAVPGLVAAQMTPRPAAASGGALTTVHRHSRPPTPAPVRSLTASASAPVAIPPDFRPSSVTFVGTATGWALGQSGQARYCGAAQTPCMWLTRTGDTGASWAALARLPAGPPAGAAGVSEVRFLNTRDGWVSGPQLLATHNGGRSWRALPTSGQRVTALETAGRRVLAVLARCSGGGPGFAGHCTRFALYSSPAGRDNFQLVPFTQGATAGSKPGSAALVLAGGEGYLMLPGGRLLRGPVAGGPWAPAGRAALPCSPGAPLPDGQPSRAMLSATTGAGLLLLCAGRPVGGSQPKTMWYSPDGGQIWQPAGTPPSAGVAQSLSGSPSGAFLIATDLGIVVSTDHGASWRAASAVTPPGGFSYVGMTFSLQGVALAASPRQPALWITRDGGLSWQKSHIR